jgi:hypothetical protein
MRNAYKNLVGNPEGKRPCGRLRRTLEDNIRIYVTEIWWKILEWIHLAQDRDRLAALVKTIMNLRIP